MADPDARQLWLGNIPAELDEQQVHDELRVFGVRPTKVVLRQREGKESWAIVTFATPEHAAAASTRSVDFFNKAKAVFRPAGACNRCITCSRISRFALKLARLGLVCVSRFSSVVPRIMCVARARAPEASSAEEELQAACAACVLVGEFLNGRLRRAAEVAAQGRASAATGARSLLCHASWLPNVVDSGP